MFNVCCSWWIYSIFFRKRYQIVNPAYIVPVSKENYVKKIIRKNLRKIFQTNHIDVATLSSTHLPFLLKFLKEEFPNVIFLNPANNISEKVAKKNLKNITIKRNKLSIFTTGNPEKFQENLIKIGIKNKVNSFSL